MKSENASKNQTELFRNARVGKAVLRNAIPAMIAMIMVIIYNLADTFFIGRNHNDILVATVSLATPVFLLSMTFGMVFGVGGTSVISSALGEGRHDYAKKACSFCMWCCVGARLWERFKSSFKFSIIFALLLSLVMTGICYLGSSQIVRAFLTKQDALGYAVSFSRILLSTTGLVGIFFVLVNTLQAMGAATPSLIINLSRQGLVYIPALFILNAILGVTGLEWAQPVADIISLLMAIALYVRTLKKLSFPVQVK